MEHEIKYESRIRIGGDGAVATVHIVGDEDAIRAAHDRIMRELSDLKAEYEAARQIERSFCQGCGEGLAE